MIHAMQQTVKNVADELGRSNMAHQLGVGLTTISAAISEGVFPSAWYMTLRAMSEAHDVDIPDNLFRWKKSNEATA